MLGWPEASDIFRNLQTIIIDEIHALAGTKRGDLLALSLSKMRAMRHQDTQSDIQAIGLSATVANPRRFSALLSPDEDKVAIIQPPLTKDISVSMLESRADLPWVGYSAHYAIEDIYQLLSRPSKDFGFCEYQSAS